MSDELPDRDLRTKRGPVLRKGVGLSPTGWFDPRGRALGSFAFAVNRITGLGLVFYLYLHLAVLSLLFGGEDGWNSFLETATEPFFLLLDMLLIFGLLYHGLNGVRVALVGSGFVPDKQKSLWWALGVIGTVVFLAAGIRILGDL